jgi:quercetin dioxygenase-like cupin family protein
MRVRLFTFIVAIVLVTGYWLPATCTVGAQADDIKTQALISVNLAKGTLPPAPAFLRLVRITLEPGATSVAHTHPGPEIGRVDAGVISVTVQGPASVKQRSAKPKDPFEAIESGKPTTLDRGDQVYYPAGTVIEFTNKGDDPAQVLAVVILPAAEGHPDLITYAEATPTDEVFKGVTSEVLGDAVMTTIPTGDATVTLDRVQLQPGQSLPGTSYPVLFSVESGDCQFSISGGQVQLSRKREPGAQTDLPQDENIKLRSGDAMFFPNGLRTTSRGETSAGLDLLRVIVGPGPGSDEKLAQDGRGSIRFKAPDVADEDTGDSGDQASNEIGNGSSVYVNSTDVNMRDSPGLGAGLVTVLLYGQELTVDGPAVDGDGIRWWPVHITSDPSISGYVADEFIQTTPAE